MIAVVMSAGICVAQPPAAFAKWAWLMGEWKGEGNGKPGAGEGTFSFKEDLDGKVLIRKAHSEYEANGNMPHTIHNDLMIVYADYTGNPSKAIYFDNEGHTINYSVTYTGKTIVLLSEKIAGVPTFRLTYTLLDDETVDTKFEMSRDGINFSTYIEGKSRKVK